MNKTLTFLMPVYFTPSMPDTGIIENTITGGSNSVESSEPGPGDYAPLELRAQLVVNSSNELNNRLHRLRARI